MSSLLVTVAEAVKDELQTGSDAGSFATEFQPVRSYPDWDWPLETPDDLRVDVVAVNTSPVDLDTRESVAYEIRVDVGVRYKFKREDGDQDTGHITVEVVDDFVVLVEQIAEYFASSSRWRLTDVGNAVWTSSEIRVAGDVKHLRELRQFTGVVRLTFRVDKAL